MPRLLNIISALTSGLLDSIRFVVAIDLAVILFWSLGEITWSVYQSSEYRWLAFLFGVTIAITLIVIIWRWVKPQSFGLATAATGNLNILPLALLNFVILFAAIFVADTFGKPTTPLLRFVNTMVQKFTS